MPRIKEDYFSDVLKQFETELINAIKEEIGLGQSLAIENAKQSGVNTSLNPLNISKKDIKTFSDKIFLNIKDANQDLSKGITNAVLDNVANRGSNEDLAKQIKNLFDKDSAKHINYKNRFKTIARTESTNILNISSNNTAKKLGATKKYLSGVNDARQGGDSKVALTKYGSPEKAIPLDKNFKFSFGKNNYDYNLPPNRPNDRELVLYLFD